jgi:hypothetical protein
VVYNGEQIANSTGVHPKVLMLDTDNRLATLRLTEGRYLDRQVLYLSTESSDTPALGRDAGSLDARRDRRRAACSHRQPPDSRAPVQRRLAREFQPDRTEPGPIPKFSAFAP